MTRVDIADKIVASQILTNWTGVLTENQVKTLTYWPYVFLEGLKTSEVEIDTSNQAIEYRLVMKKGKKAEGQKFLAVIAPAVRMLLGSAWYTTVKVGRKTVVSVQGAVNPNAEPIEFGQGRKGFDPEGARSVRKVRGGRKASTSSK